MGTEAWPMAPTQSSLLTDRPQLSTVVPLYSVTSEMVSCSAIRAGGANV